MQAEELDGLETALRRMCQEQDIAWLIAEVDAAIAEGFAESVNPGSSAYRLRGGAPFGYRYDEPKRGRPQVEIHQRPYTAEERVLLILNAMLAVYRDLPDLAAETLSVLGTGWQGRVTAPDSVVLSADTEDEADPAALTLEPELTDDRVRRQRVVEILIALRAEVIQ